MSDGLVAAVDKNNALLVDLVGFNVRNVILQDRNVVDNDDDTDDDLWNDMVDLITEIDCIEYIWINNMRTIDHIKLNEVIVSYHSQHKSFM